MKTLKSFIQPLVVRWQMRDLCFCCGDKATQKCRTHGTKICGHAFCRLEHRRCRSAVHGSLTNPFCELSLRTTWQMHLLRTAVALVVGLLVVGFLAL